MKTPALLLLAATTLALADPPEPRFTAITLDDKIQIGYGLAIADVDGDKLPDLLLADKRQIVWYRNPGPDQARDPAAWHKYLIAENLTEHDNVCLAAQDLDGDGKCELAVGAEWNPGNTEHSGAVFYLIAPADRTQRWEPVKFPSVEPTTHRMKWVQFAQNEWGLVVLPLHGRGNKNGEGARVKVLLYRKPADPKEEWKSEELSDTRHMNDPFSALHMTHNFDVSAYHQGDLKARLIVAASEGLNAISYSYEKPGSGKGFFDGRVATHERLPAGEVRQGWLNERDGFLATVEPMHGNSLIVYPTVFASENTDGEGRKSTTWTSSRHLLTDKLIEGHALACGDLLGVKSDQIVVGWRGNPAKPDNTFGIHLWTPLDATGEHWRESVVDDGGLACEDLVLADLDGDGRPDIVASGRATHNVKLYFNDTPR